MTKRILSLMMALLLALGLVACGGGDTSEDAPSEDGGTPPATVLDPGAEPEEEPEPEPLNQEFLTGLEKGADYPEGKRITAVMVNNVTSARPNNGISQAKVLVEIKVEGGITRYMALFDDYETMPTVGSVRSARDQFLQLLIPYWGYYIHEGPGGEHPVNWLLRDYNYSEFDLTRNYYGDLLTKVPERSTKDYSWFNATAQSAADTIAAKESDDAHTYSSPLFNFVSYNEEARVPGDGEATDIAVIHSASYRTLFQYNSGTAKYDMSQYNASTGSVDRTVDGNDETPLSFDNLVVLFAPMSIYAGTEVLPKFDYSVGGAGYYISNGGYELLRWTKGAAEQPLLLYKWDGSGEMVQVNPGTTYLAVVDDEELPSFHEVMTTGTASQEVSEGEIIENEVDIAD